MEQNPKMNLLISAVAMMGSLLVILYLILVMPERTELIITFGVIALADTYFLVDGILKKIDDISGASLDRQSELVKVEKGIYSVAKREEATNAEKIEMLMSAIEKLKEENSRLNDKLIEQQKLFTKVSMKKNQESMNMLINGNDRIAKLIIQLTGNNNTVSTETIELLNEIHSIMEEKKKEEELLRSNVRMMPPRAE